MLEEKPPLKLDPDFSKAINTGTPNVSKIERNINPSKIEGSLKEFKDYFKPGQVFVNEGLEDARAQSQSTLEKGTNILVKGATTFIGSLAETAGTVGSLLTSTGKLITGDTDFMNNWLANPLMKGIEHLQEDIKENFPVYLTKEQQEDKNLVDYITTPTKIIDDLTQGVAFLASMYVPMNWVSKPFQGARALSKATKAGKLLDEAGSISKWFEAENIKKLQALKPEEWAAAGFNNADQLADIQTKLGRTQKLLEKTGQFTGALVGRLGESAMESDQTYNGLIQKGVSKDKAREAANNVFYGNMLLSVVDYYQYGKLFGKAGGKKIFENELKEKALSNIVLDEGEKAIYKSPSRLEKIANNVWNVVKTAGSEGYEELQQYSFQEVAKKLALDNVDQSDIDGFLKFAGQSANKLPEALTEIEGQKAALLGSLLGGVGAGISNIGGNSRIDKLGQDTVKYFNTLNENKYDPTQLFVKQEDGGVTINNEYLRNLNNFSLIEAYKDIADKTGDKVEYQRLSDLQLLNKAISYSLIGKEDSLFSTLETLKGATPAEISKIVDIDENEIEDPTKTIDEKISKAKRYVEVLKSIDSDPSLANLNLDAKRTVAYKLGNFEINKDAIDGIAPQIAQLESDNTNILSKYLEENVINTQEDITKLNDVVAQAKQLKGLTDNRKQELIQLREKKDQLLKENKEILEWYNKQRKDVYELNSKVREVNDIKKQTNVDNAAINNVAEESKTEEGKNLYKNNVGADNDGNFLSSEFEINLGTEEKPDNRTLVFTKDNANYLVDKNNPSTKFYNVEEVATKSTITPIQEIKNNNDLKKDIEKRREEELKKANEEWQANVDDKGYPKESLQPIEEKINEKYNKELAELQTKLNSKTRKEKPTLDNPETEIIEPIDAFKTFDPINRKSIKGGFFTTSSKHLDNNNELSSSENVKRFHAFTSSINNSNAKDYQGLLVTKDHPIYGINSEKNIFGEVGDKFIDNAILLLITDNSGIPVQYDEGLVYSNIQLPSLKYSTFGNNENRFYDQYTDGDTKGVSKTLEEQYVKAFTNFRNNVLNLYSKNKEQNLFVSITGVSDGIVVKDKQSKNLVLGNILSFDNTIISNINDIPVIITTGEDITIDGNSVKVKPGKIFTISNGRKIPLNTRKLTNKEANDIVKLINLYYQLIKDKQNNIKVKDILINPRQILDSIIYLRQDGTPTQVQVYDEVLIFGDTVININKNTIDSIAAGFLNDKLLSVIQNKPHQINKKILDSNKKFNHYFYNESGDLDFKTYKSYKEYLLTAKIPALTVSIKIPIPNDINNPPFIGAYLKFDNGIRNSIKKDVPLLNKVEEVVEPNIIENKDVKQIEGTEVTSIKDFIIGEDYYFINSADKNKVRKPFSVKSLDPIDIKKIEAKLRIGKVYKIEKEKTPSTELKVNEIIGNIFNFNQSDGKEPLFRNILFSENPLDFQQAKSWLENNLPKAFHENIEQVIGLIAGRKGGAVLNGGKILLSNLAGEGTEYHEAWHIVTQFLLSGNKRKDLYNEYRDRVNNYELSDYEVEEQLAEEFRTYVMLNGNYEIPSIQKNIFQKILDFIKSLIGLSKEKNIEDVFNKINSGGFVNSQVLTTELQSMLGSEGNISFESALENNVFSAELISSFNELVGKFIFDKYDGNNIELLYNNFSFRDEIWEQIYSDLVNTFNDTLKRIYTETKDPNEIRTKLIAEIPLIAQLVAKGDNGELIGLKYFNMLKDKYSTYIQKLGFKKKILDDEFENNTLEVDDVEGRLEEHDPDITAGFMDFRSSVEVSTKDGIPSVLKIFISMLPSGTTSILGIPQTVDYDYTLNYLQNLLAGQNKLEDMIKLIEKSKLNDITIKAITDRLRVYNDSLTSVQFDLQSAFYNQFAKTKNDSLLAIIKNDEDNENNKKVFFKNSNKDLIRNKIKDLWTNNLKSSLYTYIKDGKILIDKTKLSTINTNTFNDKLKYLEALGIKFTSPDNLPNNIFDTNKAADFVKIKEAIEKVIDLSNIFSKKNEITGRLNALVEEELKYTDKIVENQFITPDGKTAYGITLNNFLTNVTNKLNNGIIPTFLNPKNNSYTTNSVILNKIIEGKKNVIKVNILSGISEDNGEGKSTQNTTKGERLLQQINAIILNNTYPFLRAESSKTEFSFELNEPIIDFSGNFEQTLEEAVKVFYNYLLDEIEQSKLNKDYSGQVTNRLTIFEDIVDQDELLDITNNKYRIEGKIRNYIYKEISNNLDSLKKYNISREINGIYNIVGIDAYKKVNGTTKVDHSGLYNFVTAFTVNSLAMNIEQSKLFTGDFRYYKDVINLFKRTKAIVGTKLPLRTDNKTNDWLNENFERNDGKLYGTTFNTLVIDDYVKDLANKELQELGYTKVNIADAQGIFNINFLRELLKRSGKWTSEQENLFQKEMKGDYIDIYNKNALFQTQKPQYFGNQLNNNGFVPTLYKYAAYTLYPSLVNQKDKEDNLLFPVLKQLYELMTNSKSPIDQILFESGNKVGRKLVDNKTLKLFNEDGTIIIPDNYSDFLQNTYLDNFGIQVENKPLEKDLVTTGTQYRAIITSNIFENGKPKNEKLGKLADELDDVFNQITRIYTNNFLTKFNFEKDGDNYKFNGDKGKLKRVLISELNVREVPSNIYNSVILTLQESEESEFDVLVNKNKLENILFSIINNTIIKQKMKGDMKAQVSSAGYYSFDKDNIKKSNNLEFYRRGENGETLAAECYLPYYFKKFIKGGEININELPNELKTIIAYRIPTEQLNSIDVFIVKDFLPTESGNMIVLPDGMTTKSGGDFDYDKLTIFIPNYSIGKPEELPNYDKYNNDLENSTITQLQNRVIEITKEILLHPDNFKNLIQPNSTDRIKEVSDIIQELKGIDIKNKYIPFTRAIELDFLNNIAEQYWKGKSLVGVFALHNKIHSLFQKVGGIINRDKLSLKFSTFKNIEGNYDLGRIYQLDDNGKDTDSKISNLNGSLISLTVDVAKNPDVLYNLNVSFETADLISMLARLGLNTETIFTFINQPIIKHYLDIKELTGSLYQDNISQAKIVETAFVRLKLGEQKTNEGMMLDSKILKKEISKPTLNIQSQVMSDFLHYKDIANRLAAVNRTVNADTSGVGKNRNFTAIKKKQLQEVLETSDLQELNSNNKLVLSSTLSGVDNLINKTFLKEFVNVVTNVSSVWDEFFLTSKNKKLAKLKDDFLNSIRKRVFSLDKVNKLADNFDNDLIQYIIQTTPIDGKTINLRIDELFKSDKSFGKRLNKYLNYINPETKRYSANLTLRRELQPLINRDGKIDNVKLFAKKLNNIEANELTSALKSMFETQPLLAESMMEFIILQSGFNNSPINFIQVIPVDYWFPFVKKYISNFKNYDVDLSNFEEQFYKNNWSNTDLIPRYPVTFKSTQVSKTFRTTKRRYSNNKYIKIVNQGLTAEDRKVYLYEQYADDSKALSYKLVNKFGDGMYLKEYGVSESIIKDNNIPETLNIVDNEENINKQINNISNNFLDESGKPIC